MRTLTSEEQSWGVPANISSGIEIKTFVENVSMCMLIGKIWVDHAGTEHVTLYQYHMKSNRDSYRDSSGVTQSQAHGWGWGWSQDSRGPTVGNPSAGAVPGPARSPAPRIVPRGPGKEPGPHRFLEVTVLTEKGRRVALFYFKPLWRGGSRPWSGSPVMRLLWEYPRECPPGPPRSPVV